MESGRKVSVCAVMTAARYECTFARNMIERALRTLNIPLSVSGGVYYGQCMQKMLEQLVDHGEIDYAVTVDGDSLFTAEQLSRLMAIIVQEDKIDAIAAMQCRRGMNTMLGTIEGKTETEYHGYPLKVDTAHFGLTVLDLKKLRSVKKPWFFSQPNEDGMWETTKIDCDIWFWKQWREAGHSVYIDCDCRIGHLEEMVSVFDDKMKPTFMHTADWSKANGY